MTRIEDILSRALLARDRTVPRDIVPTTCPTARQAQTAPDAPVGTTAEGDAAEDLRALCETLVSHTPATDVADFVTEQVPQPRSALALACVLQLTDTDDGARFWWQYAAGAGQPAAAYCLYLHHLAQGEDATADWWHRQTDDVEPVPDSPAAAQPGTPGPDQPHSTSTTTILRILRHLSKHSVRPRTTAVTHLMAYMPTAVTIGYLREPDMDLPLPGPDFAHHVSELLTAAGRPDVSDTLPGRKSYDARSLQEAVSR
ncbi:hypothetical protein OKJ48_04580 [Streptomyces kunmingensis]|uniref:Uncharacterized protein n=1 Tax=Streptomyces kunmingensis TaxID=68225 RepID=A0ABU6C4Q6_9ACTN|nr:hypothetical protein [Streptomyces kunmingensis]MEB3959533.1 hypothetical protein [Streptomyces kunmingensis]